MLLTRTVLLRGRCADCMMGAQGTEENAFVIQLHIEKSTRMENTCAENVRKYPVLKPTTHVAFLHFQNTKRFLSGWGVVNITCSILMNM